MLRVTLAAMCAVNTVSSDWNVTQNIDVVAGVSAHSANLGVVSDTGSAGALKCQALCGNATGCNIYTFNHHTQDRSTSCFGGIDADMHWSNTVNDHCLSGCRGDACAPAPVPTPAPLPPGARMPVYVGKHPEIATNRSAGLRPIPGAQHITVYNATTPDGKSNRHGTYNHGPILVKYDETYFVSWYNSPKDENLKKRSVFATSTDGGSTWSEPRVLFPEFTAQPQTDAGEENGPWSVLGASPAGADGTGGSMGRLYTQSGTQDAGEHHEGIISVARRVYSNKVREWQ